jgi:hypothetical protein
MAWLMSIIFLIKFFKKGLKGWERLEFGQNWRGIKGKESFLFPYTSWYDSVLGIAVFATKIIKLKRWSNLL